MDTESAEEVVVGRRGVAAWGVSPSTAVCADVSDTVGRVAVVVDVAVEVVEEEEELVGAALLSGTPATIPTDTKCCPCPCPCPSPCPCTSGNIKPSSRTRLSLATCFSISRISPRLRDRLL